MTLNAMQVPAGRALTVLRSGWAAQAAGKLTTSWMLHGRPGVGKTDIVAQLARDIGARLFDLRLTTLDPQDLRGLPYYDHEARKTVWYRPEDLPDDPQTPAILFLDELTAASPVLQPTVYGLLQERRVGRHSLPDSVFVVAAGNTVEDGTVAYEMGSALSDRLVHMHVVASAADWIENYAVPQRLHPAVTAFIRTRPDLLDTGDRALETGEVIAATPRSWARVSEILTAIGDRDQQKIMVAGTVGTALATEFSLVADDVQASLRLEELLRLDGDRRAGAYPDSLHGLHALVYALAARLDADTLPKAIEVLAGIGDLARTRPDAPALSKLPLAELTTHGFEVLIARALDLGLGEIFAASPVYRAYHAQRQAEGLA